MNNIDVVVKKRLISLLIEEKEHFLRTNRREFSHKVETANRLCESASDRVEDTSRADASYTAGTLSSSIDALHQDIGRLRAVMDNGIHIGGPVAIGSIVCVTPKSQASTPEYYFLLPAAGGSELTPDELNGAEICVVTPQSPLGQLLYGRTKGDTVSFRDRNLKIADVI